MPSSNDDVKPPIEPQFLSVSELIRHASIPGLGPDSPCRIVQVALQDGIELFSSSGRFHAPVQIGTYDDSNRIQFTFTLTGRAESWFADQNKRQEHVVRAGSGSIYFGPGRRGFFRQQGEYANVTVMVRPDVFGPWLGEVDGELTRALAGGQCAAVGLRGAELQATSHVLFHALQASVASDRVPSTRHQLWLHGQALTMLGLFLEGRTAAFAAERGLPAADLHRLMRARELLLSDLSKAPTLAELAWESGLSLVKLKRGFQQVFGCSVYNLFQQERMHEARRLLRRDAVSVTSVAADMGYTNSSHFAAAFRKQFGINPAAAQRAMVG